MFLKKINSASRRLAAPNHATQPAIPAGVLSPSELRRIVASIIG